MIQLFPAGLDGFGVYLWHCRFAIKPRRVCEGPYWAVWWFGVVLTNANVPLMRRIIASLESQPI